MRLEFEPNATAAPFVEKDVVSQDTASENEKLLRDGVKAAQEGKRSEARNLLLRVTETDADNENAWLWLASISEYPEELLVFLNNVLRINSQNERALEWHKATKSLLAKTLVQRGIDAASENRKEFARQCFEQAVEHEAENEMAWLWMASVADSEEEKAGFFGQVLSINPQNETAAESLRSIQSQKMQKMFADALEAAFEGDHAAAKESLEQVLESEPEMEDAWILKSHLAASFEERAECFLKISALNPDNEMAKASLASWRALADKRADQSKAEEKAPETFTEKAPEQFFAEENSSEETSNEEVSESEAETTYLDQPTIEPVPLFAQTPLAEEFASHDSPTQELSSAASETVEQETAPEFSAEETTAEPAAENSVPETNFAPEFEGSEINFENENEETAPEFSAPPVNLAAELEAEEAEMNWAFSNGSAEKEAVDYFQNFDEDDDIHKTQQANYTAADFADDSDIQAVSAEKPVEDWRDTSPNVFVNYVPEVPESTFEEKTNGFYPVAVQAEEEAPAETFAPAEEPAAAVTEEIPAEETFSMNAAVEAVEEVSTPLEQAVEVQTEEKSAVFKTESALCPFCSAENDKQAFSCVSCQTVLTLSDLEMLLSQQTADQEKLQQAVSSLERENESYGLSAEQLMNLGIGHVNLKNHRQGFYYLQEAVRMNPSNVLLDAQVNALAIRLSEMEEQQSVHDSMPKNRKILVVDDSPTVRKLISGKLEKCGHEVICAVDGVDALEKINELKPDLVLLDITMPRMDGYQVCKQIRSLEATKDVPVVMISGKDGFFDKVRGRMAGTTGYITKPFGPETLMKTVETYLN